ncbi:hypothetical protein Ancab_017414 [Ancistrocladus abbreviatus]
MISLLIKSVRERHHSRARDPNSFAALVRSMSHFGRSGPPDITDTYSLLVLNISFRTAADDLFPLFDKYGKVVDIFIPRDRRTGDSRGFAFVRYKYADEAQKAMDRLDGRLVDGREIAVQFAKYGPNAERIYRDDYGDGEHYRRRSRSRSLDRYDRDRYHGRERDYHHRSRSSSISPDNYKDRERNHYGDERKIHPSRSFDSASPARRSPSPRKRASSSRSGSGSPDRQNGRSPYS